jgi:uncharacterized protein YndB with AHSA1/START domain
MSLPSRADVTVAIAAPPEVVYDLVADVTRMGEWSPECTSCEWLGEPGQVGSRFRGHNRSGLARWSTTAEVQVADRPRAFSFATMSGDKVSTVWSYRVEPDGYGTKLTESFESVSTPFLIGIAERLFIRNRQQQLEAGIASTLAAIKAAAETAHAE